MVLKINGYVEQIQLGAWKINVLSPQQPLFLSCGVVEQLKNLVEGVMVAWRENQEPTYASVSYGLPSLIVRVDYVLDSEDQICPFEVEERPAGLGLATVTLPTFAEFWCTLAWPQKPIVVISPNRRGNDDCLWTEVFGVDNGFPDSLLLARFEPEELSQELYTKLAPLSISTLRTEGWKGYGVKLGWWQEVDSVDFNLIANKWKWEGAVVKSDGSGSKHIRIWLTAGQISRTRQHLRTSAGGIGIWSAKEIIEEQKEWRSKGKKVYLQKFYPPHPCYINGIPAYGIWRIYLGYNPNKKQWECLGGWFNARRSLLVHGASDSYFVPVFPE